MASHSKRAHTVRVHRVKKTKVVFPIQCGKALAYSLVQVGSQWKINFASFRFCHLITKLVQEGSKGPFICDQTTDIFLLGVLVC